MQRARLLCELEGRPFLTRRQRRQKERSTQDAARRTSESNAVASYIVQDDAARRRAIRLASGSAYGAQHRAVTFRFGK
jgi:hypothetical protein